MLEIKETPSVNLFCMGWSPLGFLLYPVYAFLVGDTLIDTGTNRVDKEFLSALKGRAITKIVNTHHHEDHIGNNGDIQKLFGIPIYAHSSALPYLENPRLNDLRLYQRIVWDWPKKSKGTVIEPSNLPPIRSLISWKTILSASWLSRQSELPRDR